jgi:hypothetical protein
MFGKYFYNKNIRNIVILFGTLFNDITIRRTKSDGTIQNALKVPIAYGPAQKYLTRLEQGPTNNNTDETIGMVLPRMSFEIITMAYDGTRKLQKTKKIREVKPLGTIQSINVTNGGSGYTVAPTVTIEVPPSGLNGATATATVANGAVTSITLTDNGLGYTSIPNVTISGTGTNAKATANVDSSTSSLQTIFTPVPYNFEIDLSIMVLNSDDGTQILEQILPYFTPEFQVTMNEMKTMGVKRDIPIVLNGLSSEDDYEGDFFTRRSLTHTLSFTVQGYIYGPIADQGIIREVDVNAGTFFNGIDSPLVNIDTVPNPVNADPEDNPSTTTTITDL